MPGTITFGQATWRLPLVWLILAAAASCDEVDAAVVAACFDLAIAFALVQDQVVASGGVVVPVGVEVAHNLTAREAFALQFLEDYFFVEHVGLAHNEARRVAYWLEAGLEPHVVADLCWVVPQHRVLVEDLGYEVFGIA